ncbi:hypothetical protein [Candidatus Lariskella endosymbiont of Epinotia ramella]|uniref:hypothetical protein n=1 Tax=Candidatus Lariskella endosymbiont of Epinotia ramella TaxID=3066224 RepID=UPI0030CC21A6
MLATFLQYLHAAPIALIVFIVTAAVTHSKVVERVGSEVIMALLLVLASLGLGAGHFIHENGFAHIELFDPCYGYVVTLVGVAFKLVRSKLVTKAL